eukprot:7157555-Ditylum_brightwellii.AAC.2
MGDLRVSKWVGKCKAKLSGWWQGTEWKAEEGNCYVAHNCNAGCFNAASCVEGAVCLFDVTLVDKNLHCGVEVVQVVDVVAHHVEGVPIMAQLEEICDDSVVLMMRESLWKDSS